jgi:hypothetical protein
VHSGGPAVVAGFYRAPGSEYWQSSLLLVVRTTQILSATLTRHGFLHVTNNQWGIQASHSEGSHALIFTF